MDSFRTYETGGGREECTSINEELCRGALAERLVVRPDVVVCELPALQVGPDLAGGPGQIVDLVEFLGMGALRGRHRAVELG